MKKNLPYYLAFLFCLISSAAFAQQPVEEWTKRYSGVGSQNDYPTSMTVDAAGNVYVVGTTRNSYWSDIPYSFVVVKYAPTREKLWEKVYKASTTVVASGIAVDNTGGVYVIGRIGYWGNWYDYITVRFDAATGNVDWEDTYNGASNGPDEPTAIAVDNMGGVYVTGTSSTIGPIGNVGDFVTIRYDALTGGRSWVSSYDGYNGGHDIPAAIAVDKNGSVYVTGYSDGGGVLPTNATIRYDAATGAEKWVQRGGSATDIAVDNLGGVYVTGTKSNPISNNDFSTIRYDAATGALSWEMPFNGSLNGNDQAVAITTDNEGGVYVTGHSEIAGNSYDFVTIRYNAATGSSSWIETYDGGFDQASGIVADNQGSVFITGSSLINGHYDFVTIRYVAASGNRSWVMRYDGPAHGFDISSEIAVDGLGGLYVSGSSMGIGTGSDIATVRYVAATGVESWVNRLDIKGPLADRAIAIATDEAGNSYVTGNSTYFNDFIGRVNSFTTIKYSPSGEELWVRHFDAGEDRLARGNNVRAIAVDNQGGVYVTGSSYRNNNDMDFVTIRYDAATGDEDWASYYNGPQNGNDAATALVVGQGGVFVTGYSLRYLTPNLTEYNDYATIRYDAATGKEDWVMRSDNTSNGDDVPTGIALNTQGELFVTGYSSGESTNRDYLTISYNAADGTERWRKRYNTEGSSADLAAAIAVDNQGGVYVTGNIEIWDLVNPIRDIVTIRYNTENGDPDWIQRYDGSSQSSDFAISIVTDNQGGVFIGGSVLIRYEGSSGLQSWVNPDASAYDMVVDNAGAIYTLHTISTETGEGVFSTAKYASTDGSLIWHIESPGPEDWAAAIALDPAGNIFVTGYSHTPLTDHDFLTIKYSQSGTCAPLAQASIQGSTTAAMGARGVVYSINAPGATTFEWRITDNHGDPYTAFTGQGSSSISVDWPSAPHAFKVSVMYSTSAACPTLQSVAYVHVYAVEAGFVTGGGWMHSPVNRAYELMQQPGKVHFELMAKYQKGDQNLVQGETQLRIENNNLIFRSSQHEARSLVIDGNHAFYRGYGTVSYRNDRGQQVRDPRRFAFLVSATDSSPGPGNGHGRPADLLRVMIWALNADGSRGALVYDNQTGFAGANLDENAHAVQRINGGNIVIHSPNLAQSKKNKLEGGQGIPAPTGLIAYPTAFNDRTTLSFAAEAPSAFRLELYDLKGSLVKRIADGTTVTGEQYTYEVQAAELGKGMYLARLTTNGTVQTVKIIVNR